MHEHGWTAEKTEGKLSFVAPSGRRVEAAPRLEAVDLVALQDNLHGPMLGRALCATGGWEPVDYPEIIHALVEVSTR